MRVYILPFLLTSLCGFPSLEPPMLLLKAVGKLKIASCFYIVVYTEMEQQASAHTAPGSGSPARFSP